MSELTLLSDRTVNTESAYPGTWGIGVDIVDRYSGFEHRVADANTTLTNPPTWVTSVEDRRRLVSYRIAKAAQETVARFFHDREGLSNDFDQLREHGHANAYVERLVDAILGEAPRLLVPGADVAVPSRPILPRKPDELGETEDEIEQLVSEAVKEFYLAEARRAIEDWKKASVEHPNLTARQKWLDGWARDSLFWQEVYEAESEHVVPQGDAVLELSIDENSRPKVRAIEPSAFFKIWTPDSRSDFPDRVHLAWEFHRQGMSGPETWVRRITYELLPVEPWTPVYQTRPTQKRCFITDGDWQISGPGSPRRMSPLDLNDFPATEGVYRMIEHPFEPGEQVQAFEVPLPIDFLPVVHLQHTLGRWGRSAYARTMALLDDINAADTAAALVASLCGEPPLAASGGVVDEQMVLGAAALIDLGTEGKVAKLGFADELRALIEYGGSLERQFMKMTSLSGELSGRENNEQSGRAIGLKMTPFRQTVLRARLARQQAYTLTLKFVQRLAIIAGTEGFEGPVMPAELKWGTFIPEDLSALVEQIVLLRDRGLLTDSDVYDLLIAAGLSIKDADASLEELRSMNIRVAEPLMTILGRRAAAEFLNREFDEDDPSLKGPDPRPTEELSPRANPGSGDRNDVGPARERSNPAGLPD